MQPIGRGGSRTIQGAPCSGANRAMICVTIGRGRHSSLAEEWKEAAEAGVDLVELRIDCLRREPDLKRILKDRPTPIVFTIRRGVDGGLWRGNEEKRQQLLREAIAAGVDYVDLEMDIAPKIRRFGKTKRIISYHNMKTTPVDLADIAEQCEELDPDVVKIATAATTLAEASRVLAPGQPSPRPPRSRSPWARSASSRGSSGRSTAPRSPTPASIPSGSSPPGMQPLPDPQERLRLRPDQRRDRGLRRDRRPDRAEPQPGRAQRRVPPPRAEQGHGARSWCPTDELPAFFKELMWLDLKGCSVTIPHKEAIVPLLQQKEGAVERTGTCNTVVFQEEGRRVGYNTDYRAAMDSLEEAMGGRAERGGRQPALREAGADPRGRGRGAFHRLRADAARGQRHDHQSPRRTGDPAGRGGRLPRDHLVGPGQHPGRRDHQLHPGRDAPQRGRHAAAAGGVQPGRHGRVRHDLPPREHDDAQAGARAGLPRRSRASTCFSARRPSSSSSIRGRTRRWT